MESLALLLPPVLFDLFFRPTIRRLGLRNVSRRPGEAALVVAGSMLATALITASLLVGDSFGTSIRSLAQTQYGPVDEIVEIDNPKAAADALRAANDGTLDGVLATRYGVVAVGSTGAAPVVEPELRLLELDPTLAPAFGDDPDSNGLALMPALSANEIVVNAQIADRLGVEMGDTVEIFAGPEPLRMTVAAVLPRTGLAGLGEIIAAPGAITSAIPNVDDTTIGAVLVSNVGGVYEGADQTEQATALIVDTLSGSGATLEVDEVKRRLLENADLEAADQTELFGTIGGFSVVAGILLVVNLFVMVAEERKTELGTLRAVGLGRGPIRRAFTLEGAVYGALAAVAGALLGVVVAAGVMEFASRLFEADSDITLSLSVASLSLVTGGLIGFAISQLTVTITSARITRLNIIRALKDLPEPPGAGHPWRRLVIGGLGMAGGAALFLAFSSTPVVALLAPVIVAVSAIPLLARLIGGRPAAVVGCAAALAWAASVFGVMKETMNDPDITLFLLQGVLLVGLAVAIVAALDSVWVGLTRRLTGGRLAPRLGLAHPLARPVRSALLVAMYGLVIFTVTFMAVLNAVFQQQAPIFAEQAGGSFDLYVDSNSTNPWSVQELEARPEIEVAVPLQNGRLEYEIVSTSNSELASLEENTDSWRVSSLPGSFPVDRASSTIDRLSEFATDEAAWKAMVTGDEWVIVPYYSDLEVGDELLLKAEGLPDRSIRVAATTDLNWAIRAGWYVPQSLEPYFTEGFGVPTRHFIIAADGSDTDSVATALTEDGSTRGSDARTFLAVAQSEVDEQEAFLRLLQGYLGLGLLIGIAGLGVVLVRAVRERRRQLGMMKAMGIASSAVRNTFMVEAAFIGIQGVALGIGLGLLSSWQVLTKSTAFEDNLSFAIPVDWLVALTVIAVLASLGAGVIPAIRAGRTAPAVALRVTG